MLIQIHWAEKPFLNHCPSRTQTRSSSQKPARRCGAHRFRPRETRPRGSCFAAVFAAAAGAAPGLAGAAAISWEAWRPTLASFGRQSVGSRYRDGPLQPPSPEDPAGWPAG